jgi:hypothetical protein
VSRKVDKAVAEFERRGQRIRPLLVELGGEAKADAILERAREEFATLAPEAVELSGGIFDSALAGTYQYLAFYKAMRDDFPVETIGRFYADTFHLLAARVPRGLARVGYRLARPFLARRLRREAEATQANTAPGSWRFDYIESEDGDAFGVNVTRCAVCALYAKHDASEIVPWVCALDDEVSDYLAMNLARNGTRATGADCCDFRYQKTGEAKRLRLPVV